MSSNDVIGAALYLLSDALTATTGAASTVDDAQETF
jgi:enoyl-[acyl-carrier-protein] reductase (NADH)